jgi:hypothetical protein
MGSLVAYACTKDDSICTYCQRECPHERRMAAMIRQQGISRTGRRPRGVFATKVACAKNTCDLARAVSFIGTSAAKLAFASRPFLLPAWPSGSQGSPFFQAERRPRISALTLWRRFCDHHTARTRPSCNSRIRFVAVTSSAREVSGS